MGSAATVLCAPRPLAKARALRRRTVYGAAVQRVLSSSQPANGTRTLAPDWDGALRQILEGYLAAIGAGGATRVLLLLPGGASRPSGLSPRFVLHDVEAIDSLEGRFDAAIVVDAASRLPRTRRALTRLRELLPEGARILLVDACKREGLSMAQERSVLDPLVQHLGLHHLETVTRYRRDLSRAGFSVLETEDLSERVRPGWQADYRRALAAHRRASTPPTEIDEPSALPLDEGVAREQLNASLRVRAAFDSGCLRYMLFLAEAV